MRTEDEGTMESDLCAVLQDRLLEGIRPSDDEDLQAHLGSCLACFRMAAELKELPRIEAQLKTKAVEDPGDIFWARFPARVADAWEASRGEARAPVPVAALKSKTVAVFRRPLPAALLGAAAAAALFVTMPKAPLDGPLAPEGGTDDVGALVDDLLAEDDEPLTPGGETQEQSKEEAKIAAWGSPPATAGLSAAEAVAALPDDQLDALVAAFDDVPRR